MRGATVWFNAQRMLGKIFSRRHFANFSHVSQRTGFDMTCTLALKKTISMIYQSMLSGQNSKNIINLSSAEVFKRVVEFKPQIDRFLLQKAIIYNYMYRQQNYSCCYRVVRNKFSLTLTLHHVGQSLNLKCTKCRFAHAICSATTVYISLSFLHFLDKSKSWQFLGIFLFLYIK